MGNFQSKFSRLNIHQYTKPEIDIIIEQGNLNEFEIEVLMRRNKNDTIVKISNDLTNINDYGIVTEENCQIWQKNSMRIGKCLFSFYFIGKCSVNPIFAIN